MQMSVVDELTADLTTVPTHVKASRLKLSNQLLVDLGQEIVSCPPLFQRKVKNGEAVGLGNDDARPLEDVLYAIEEHAKVVFQGDSSNHLGVTNTEWAVTDHWHPLAK